jgi:HAD superfamily hydrolase (TIGR01549 family)
MSEEPLASYIVEHEKTHLIFDFDGTLALAKFPWIEWGLAVADQLRDLDGELWNMTEHHGSPGMQNLLVERHGNAALDILLNHVPEFELSHKDKLVKNDELIREIDSFRQQYHLFMWTSNSRQLVDWLLETNAMHDWFETIVTRNDVRFLKPYPEGFDLIRDRQEPLSSYLLIGDSEHDRKAALAAGIDFYRTDFFTLEK